MLRLPSYVLIALSIAFGGGTWASIEILRATSGFGSITVGPWAAYPEIQTREADPYARAHRADDGRLLLGRAEGLMFFAEADSAGTSLTGNCVYRVEGATPPARFWTLRVTDPDDRPVPGRQMAPTSLQSWRLLQDRQGRFVAHIGGNPHAGNWISVDRHGPIQLVLTLIDTPTAASVDLGEVVMPTITRLVCHDS